MNEPAADLRIVMAIASTNKNKPISEDTIIFGDSNNDLAMFEYAAVKVAMGNGSEKIKALADYITQDMFHYGIRNGLEYLGLI